MGLSRAAVPAAIDDPLGCCLMTRSASTVWQKPADTAAIAWTAEYANAGTIIPDAHQLRGSTPSNHASFSGSVPTDVMPSMSCTLRPESSNAAMVAWIMSSSGERPVLRPTLE